MSSSFDLDINNYTFSEMEELLELPKNYDEKMIEIKETKLRQNINSDPKISVQTKSQTINFIFEVKRQLLSRLRNQQNSKKKVNFAEPKEVQTKNINLEPELKQSEVLTEGNTTLIKHPTTVGATSFPSEFYQGVINPLNVRIVRKFLNIDTRFRDNYYSTQSSNFHLDLPLKFSDVVSMQLTAIELPLTFYTISKIFNSNYFMIQIGDEKEMITVPDGNYDYLSLQLYLNNYMSTLPGLFANIVFLCDMNTPLGASSGGNGRMIVAISDKYVGDLFNFSLIFSTDINGNDDKTNPLQLKLGWLLGFRQGIYEGNCTYVSEGLVNLIGPKYIYLVVDDFHNNILDGFYGAFNSSILNKNILARIALQGSVFSYLSENNLMTITTPRQYFGPVDINKLKIQLLDEYGRVLNLNNMDYSFCLMFNIPYNL